MSVQGTNPGISLVLAAPIRESVCLCVKETYIEWGIYRELTINQNLSKINTSESLTCGSIYQGPWWNCRCNLKIFRVLKVLFDESNLKILIY